MNPNFEKGVKMNPVAVLGVNFGIMEKIGFEANFGKIPPLNDMRFF